MMRILALLTTILIALSAPAEAQDNATVQKLADQFAETITRMFHFDPFENKLFPGYKGDGKNFLGFSKQLKEA